MTDEQVTQALQIEEDPLAGMGGSILDDVETFDPTAEQQPEVDSQPNEPVVFAIDGEEVPLDTILEWKKGGMLQADYTRKTQELAEARRSIEALAENPAQVVMNAIDSLPPDQRREMAAQYAAAQGLTVVGYTPSPQGTVQTSNSPIPSDWNDWAPNEQKLWLEKEALNAKVTQLGSVLNEVRGFMQDQRQSAALSSAAQNAVANIKAQTGVDVTPDALASLVKETGIPDPEKAWWATNGPSLAKSAFNAGAQKAAQKPMSPSSDNKTFDPYDPNLSTEQAIDLYNKGWKPTRV